MKNKIFISTIIICFLLILYLEFSQNEPAQVKEYAEKIRVACVGDSITFGTGIKGRNYHSYPAQLGVLLGNTWQVGNFGVNGATLLKKGDYPYWHQEAYQQALSFAPQIVVIKLGSNDSKPQNWQYKDDYESDYITLIKSFQQLESQPKIWIAYPVPSYSETGVIRDQVITEEIIPRIDQVALKTNVLVIDLHTPLSNKKELFPDTLHPNAQGAEIIAKTVFMAIRKEGK
jgi:lysophospholipase L1-like esterase